MVTVSVEPASAPFVLGKRVKLVFMLRRIVPSSMLRCADWPMRNDSLHKSHQTLLH